MSQQDNVKAAAEGVANLHLDEVTGEMVSKSELKKRIKQRQVEAKKAAKKATAQPKPASKKKDRSVRRFGSIAVLRNKISPDPRIEKDP